jgi:hypothetical protein
MRRRTRNTTPINIGNLKTKYKLYEKIKSNSPKNIYV